MNPVTSTLLKHWFKVESVFSFSRFLQREKRRVRRGDIVPFDNYGVTPFRWQLRENWYKYRRGQEGLKHIKVPKQNLGSELSFQRLLSLREDRGIWYPKIYEKSLFPLTYYFLGKRPFHWQTFPNINCTRVSHDGPFKWEEYFKNYSQNHLSWSLIKKISADTSDCMF